MFHAVFAAGRGAGAKFHRIRGRFTYEKLVRDDFATASFSGTKKSSRRRASRRLDRPRVFADTAVRARKSDVHPLHGNDAFPTGRGSNHRGGRRHARHVLTPSDYTIGRNAVCPILVDADLVSRQHATLILNYDHAHIEDLGSSNGTTVNGQLIPKDGRTRLWPNQKIQIGTATIELRRLRHGATEMSLAPSATMVKRALSEEFLRGKK